MVTKNHEKETLWSEMCRSFENYISLRCKYFKATTWEDRITTLKSALMNPNQTIIALEVIQILPDEQKWLLIDELVAVSVSYSGSGQLAQSLLLDLPRDRLGKELNRVAHKFLANDDYADMRGLLSLFRIVDARTGAEVARQALMSKSTDVQEVANDYLSSLQAGMAGGAG